MIQPATESTTQETAPSFRVLNCGSQPAAVDAINTLLACSDQENVLLQLLADDLPLNLEALMARTLCDLRCRVAIVGSSTNFAILSRISTFAQIQGRSLRIFRSNYDAQDWLVGTAP